MATRKDTRRSGIWPLAYMGVEPVAPVLLLTDNRAPTANDYDNFNVGTWWINRATAPNEELWILVNKDNNVARWIQFLTGLSGIQTLTGDFGGAVGPDGALNIDILGSGAYLFTGNPGTNTLTLSDDGTVATQYDADVGSAVPAANILNIIGDGTYTDTVGAGNTITINFTPDAWADTYTCDVGNAVPVAGVLNVLGGTRCSTTGAGNTVTIDVDASNLAASFPTDSGTATPDAAGVLNVLGGEVINTSGAGNTVTTNLDRGTDGQVIIGATGATSAYANITSTGGTIAITNGANTINLETTAGAGGTKVTKFTSSGTWTKDADAQNIQVLVWDAGSGGGSGRRGASTAAGGGGGGGGGGFLSWQAPAYLFPATAPVVIAAGGAGGVAQTVDNTDGNAGATPAATTSFLGLDGSPLGFIIAGTAGTNGVAAGGVTGPFTLNWYTSPYLGSLSAGAGNLTAGTNAGSLGINTGAAYWRYYFGGPGGGGGGADAVTERAGGAGSAVYSSNSNLLLAGAAGGLESTGINGAAGAANTATLVGTPSGGLGGGGGGGQSVGAAAGDGGDGGIPGGGGGGGGGSLNGTNSGAGGSGARGEIVIIEYLG